jgi:hypothetical protein
VAGVSFTGWLALHDDEPVVQDGRDQGLHVVTLAEVFVSETLGPAPEGNSGGRIMPTVRRTDDREAVQVLRYGWS